MAIDCQIRLDSRLSEEISLYLQSLKHCRWLHQRRFNPLLNQFIGNQPLVHYSYCARQCALIHVEQVFEENVFTIRGRLAHERVEQGEETSASGTRVVRDVPLWSERLGLRGKADVVEMRPQGPYPVEYKVGKRHGSHERNPAMETISEVAASVIKNTSDKPIKARGLGSLFQRGRIWWICYYSNGRRLRESSNSEKETVAVKLLKRRLADAASGKPIGPEVERTTLADLKTILLDHYRINANRSIKRVTQAFDHVLDHF